MANAADLSIREISSPREFPERIICFACKTIEDVQKWAERKGVRQVWYYRHKNSGAITAAIKRD